MGKGSFNPEALGIFNHGQNRIPLIDLSHTALEFFNLHKPRPIIGDNLDGIGQA